MTISNLALLATGPVVTKLHIEHLGATDTKNYSNGLCSHYQHGRHAQTVENFKKIYSSELVN